MLVNKGTIIFLLLLGFVMIFIGIYLKPSKNAKKEKGKPEHGFFTKAGFIERLNRSSLSNSLTNTLKNNDKLTVLFRKSKNPWNLTPNSFNAIRWGGLVLFLVLALGMIPIEWTISLVFLLFAGMCFVLPKKKYNDAAISREAQWNQLYQFIWVIKHNLNYNDPRRTWLETEKYIHAHTKNLSELENGFKDFAEHWNDENIDDYLRDNYCDFAIPKQLLEVVLNSHLTGEYPDKELTSLREIILEKMNFFVKERLSTVGAKATMCSSPFLLFSVSLVILVPIIIQLVQTFGS